ncbi:MAG: hypothetical protein JNJ54_35325 [Myxococcaceae bacterium]|nr:hypothetical protein [Myxococcaceae bacterium]
MRTLLLAFVIGAVAGFACSPAKRCTPQSCQGCCSANDTCENGDTTTSCGRAGSLCDRCVGSQLCIAGNCEGVTGTGGGSSGTGGGSAGGTGGGAPTNEFTGSFQDIWGWDGDGGRGPAVAMFDRETVGVWYRDGGALDFRRGFGNADGTFVVRDVPTGEVTLQLGRTYVVTTQRQLAFDFNRGGRRDATRATSESLLRMTIRNLEPYSSSRNAAALFFTQGGTIANIEAAALPVTPMNATSIESDLDWKRVTDALGYGLPDSARGDRGWALQYRSVNEDGGGEYSLIRSAEFPPITLVNGGSADAIADLQLPPAQPLSVAFDTAAFNALRGSFGRDTATTSFGAQLRASPAPAPISAQGLRGFVVASAFTPSPAGNQITLDVANPFPTTWGRTRIAYYSVDQARSVSDAGTPVRYAGGITLVDPAESAPAMATPRLGPVRGPQIAGRNFIEDQTGVGTSPSLAWTAPTVGAVTTYRVNVGRILANGTTADSWALFTANPGLTLPPGILTAGNAYVLSIEATSAAGYLSFSIPSASSIVISGVIRP